MRVFQTVVDEGGFAAAARLLELSPPVVTRLVADLEQHLGTRLLQRTTRKLALTEAGDAYLARVRAILHEIEDAEAAAAASTRDLRGTVRVVAQPVVATNFRLFVKACGRQQWADVCHASQKSQNNVASIVASLYSYAIENRKFLLCRR